MFHPLILIIPVVLVALLLLTVSENKFSFESINRRGTKANNDIIFEEDLPVFNFPVNMKEPQLLSQVNPSNLVPLEFHLENSTDNTHNYTTVTIPEAHSNGLLHFGSFIYVVDATGKILFLRRAEHLAYCPGQWSLTGEHESITDLTFLTWKGQQNKDLANSRIMKNLVRRGIFEELGLNFKHDVRRITPLTEFPLYYKRKFESKYGKKYDRQLTYLALVRLKQPYYDLNIYYDDEVMERRWVDIRNASAFIESRKMCHSFDHTLFEIGLEALKDNLSIVEI